MGLGSQVGIGSAAGAGATLIMSVVMLLAQRAGLIRKQPPEEIVDRSLIRLGLPPGGQATDAAATLAHLGFGTVVGAGYGLVSPVLRTMPAPVGGALYGLAVWVSSYVGVLPALGLMPPAERDEPGRQPAMVAAHLVYGAVLGALYRRPGGAR